MLLLRTSRTALETHCYVLAAGAGGPAVVVDPGAGAAQALPPLLAEHRLTVGAVVVTHGHADHLWDAAAVAGAAPVHLAGPDLYRMSDPAGALGELGEYFRRLTGTAWREPDLVRPFPAGWLEGGGDEVVPGIVLRAVPAPGHTEGSAVLLVRTTLGPGDVQPADLLPRDVLAPDGPTEVLLGLCGDVLFAGSMGRTDLPGGDEREMLSTLRTLATALPPETVLLPGHGPSTSLSAELATNPYLRRAIG